MKNSPSTVRQINTAIDAIGAQGNDTSTAERAFRAFVAFSDNDQILAFALSGLKR